MHWPYPRIVGQKFNVPGFAGGYQNCIFINLSIFVYGKSIGADDFKLMTMEMDGVMMHLYVAESYPYRISEIDF